MPRKSKYPRLRVHVRKGKGGQVWQSWFYDMRHEGLPDIPLGNDYESALKRWDEIHNQKPRITGTLRQAFDDWERDVLPTYESKVTLRDYKQHLRHLRPVFDTATWDSITFQTLKAYLKKRTAKTRGNREMALLSIIWRWAYGEGLTTLQWPAAGMEKSRWKNKEKPRKFKVTDELFDAVYAEGDQVLRDCMDLSTATAMRLTDCRTIVMPRDGILHLSASKTGKESEFVVSLSEVLPGLIERRATYKASHLMLLSTPAGRPVSEAMLRARWDDAREKAAAKYPALAERIGLMFLRDMRKRASDLTDSDEEAARLLQHDSVALTRKHYRSTVQRVKTTR